MLIAVQKIGKLCLIQISRFLLPRPFCRFLGAVEKYVNKKNNLTNNEQEKNDNKDFYPMFGFHKLLKQCV